VDGRRAGIGITTAATAALAAAAQWLPADEPGTFEVQELPAGVTSQMIVQGRDLFRTDALCHACHGVDGKGIPNLGSDLTDREWKHIDGSYPQIVVLITKGVTAEASSSGIPMPPRAGAKLSDNQVRFVAAYVWTLSRTQ
jgi:mono/diheme cytochrome c family protein